jgi:hypothetical protein
VSQGRDAVQPLIVGKRSTVVPAIIHKANVDQVGMLFLRMIIFAGLPFAAWTTICAFLGHICGFVKSLPKRGFELKKRFLPRLAQEDCAGC